MSQAKSPRREILLLSLVSITTWRSRHIPRGPQLILGLGLQDLVGLAVDALRLVLYEKAFLALRCEKPLGPETGAPGTRSKKHGSRGAQ